MLAGHFKVHGITIADIKKYTGFTNVIGICRDLGIELYKLTKTQYSPLSTNDVRKVIREIRNRQGRRFSKSIQHSTKFSDHGAEISGQKDKK